MNILIYGGCHASAFKRILDRYAVDEHHIDTLVNFRLVAEKKPFPYEILEKYELVIFNPIMNKADLNTIHLEEACKQRGIKYFKFPWLQWGGYWPGARKRFWGKYSEWGLPLVPSLAGIVDKGAAASSPEVSSPGFDSYYDALFEKNNFEDKMQQVVEDTTRQLRSLEEAGAVDIRISDFILENYRQEQLFLTPDHPTNALYKYIIKNMCEALGLRIDQAFYGSAINVQEGVRTPILPGVAAALGLGFSSTEWAHKEFLGENYYTLKEWAKSSFPASKMVLGVTKNNTRVKQTDGAKALSFPKNSAVLLTESGEKDVSGYFCGTLSGPSDVNFGHALLFRPHWDFYTPSA